MQTSTHPDDLFESDSIRAAREYQRSRISYAKGSPFRLPGKILSISSHPSGLIGVGCSNGIAYLLQVGKNRLILQTTCKGHTGPVSAIQFFQRAHQLLIITGSWDRSIKIFDAWNGSLLETFDQLLPDLIKSISLLSIESLTLIIGDARGSLCFLDVFQNRKTIKKVCSRSIEAMRVTGAQAFIASSEGLVFSIVIDRVDFSIEKNDDLFSKTNEQHATSIYSMELVPPDTLYTGSADGYIFAWDTPSGSRIWRSKDLKSWVRSLGYSERRKNLLFAGLSDGTIHLFHNQELEFTLSSGGHFDAITGSVCIAYENTEYLITASLDGTIRSWVIPPDGKPRLEELPSPSGDEDLDVLLFDREDDINN